MTDIEHKSAPVRQTDIEERIAAAGLRIAALQRRLDEALAELVRSLPNDSIHGGRRA